ncbi:MAG: TetR/AcrR family transcriptional regulator [Mogibacterium sp.]|nr:TetR/AcrR family transcriptional regulator [Mogibacterium sp.]MBR4090929.1 TetR/AcrR family transcriptional regulator [Mogibacterium sp.]
MQKKKSSKELLRESAIELFSKYPVDRVSVNMICEYCGVSQRTFYNHFRDRNDLIAKVYTAILDEVELRNGESRTLHDYICALVQGICDNSDFYVNIVKYTGQNNFRLSIFQPLKDCICKLITTVFHDEITEELLVAIDIYLFGCIGYMEHNLLINNVIPASATIPAFEKLMPPSLVKYL